jgi:hypothetical protein
MDCELTNQQKQNRLAAREFAKGELAPIGKDCEFCDHPHFNPPSKGRRFFRELDAPHLCCGLFISIRRYSYG